MVKNSVIFVTIMFWVFWVMPALIEWVLFP